MWYLLIVWLIFETVTSLFFLEWELERSRDVDARDDEIILSRLVK